MTSSRAIRYILCFTLFVWVLGGLLVGRGVFAAGEGGSLFSLPLNQEEQPPEDKLELSAKYPTFEGKSGDRFEYEVDMKWLGSEAKAFDLAIIDVPPKWDATIIAGYPEKAISEIGLESEMTYPEKLRIKFAPRTGEFPEPGDYVVTLEASSGDIKETIELKAVVTAIYMFAFYTDTGRLNAEATAGEDNHLSIKVFNTGTAVIDKVDLFSDKPKGWSITFKPDKVEFLEPGLAQEVAVTIAPPRRTIAGDYAVTMKAISAGMSEREIKLRVTVLTPTIWGWVGILIVVAVIAGLAVVFRRLGRR